MPSRLSITDRPKFIQSTILLCITAIAFVVTLPAGLIPILSQRVAWGLLVGLFTQGVTRIGEKSMSPGLVRSLFQSLFAGLFTALIILSIASVTFANLSPAGEKFTRALSLTMIQEPFLVAMWTVVSSYIRTTRISWGIFGFLCLLLFLFSVLLAFAVGFGVE